MDVTDWLSAVTAQCHFVVSPELAARVSPDLCLDGPALFTIRGEDSEEPSIALPTHCLADLAGPVTELLTLLVESAISEGERENFADFGPAQWARDRLATLLASLVVEAARVSPRATGIPFLALAKLTSGMLTPGAASAPQSNALSAAISSLNELDAPRQGEIMSLMAWSLAARCSAAWGLAAQIDPTIRPTRFYQAMVRSRLAFVRRCSDPLPPTALLLATLELAGDPVLLDALRLVTEQGLTELEAHVAESRASATERQLSALLQTLLPGDLPADRRARVSSFDPTVSTTYLMRLGQLAKPKDLRKAGIDRKQARQLLEPEALQALSAVLRDLLTAVQLWDLVGGVQSLLIAPDEVSSTPWRRGVQPNLLVPRGSRRSSAQYVVALRVGELRAQALEESDNQADPLIPAAIEAAIDRAAERAIEAGALRQGSGAHELFFLPSASAALQIAQLLAEALTPPLPLQFGAMREGQSIPRGASIGVGLSTGPVHGGVDGERVALYGACIEEAAGLTGLRAPGQILGDPLHLRHVAATPTGLVSRGLLASAAFITALQDEGRRQGNPIRTPAPGQEVAGIGTPFKAYPVAGAQEDRAGLVTVLLPLDPDTAGSPVEVRQLKAEAFRDFHRHDQSLSPGDCRATNAPPPGVPAPAPEWVPPRSSAPKAAVMADPFSTDPEPVPSSPAYDDGFSFDDPEDGEEEFEFEIEAPSAPAPQPTSSEEFEVDSSFSSEPGEVGGFDEGVLVFDEATVQEGVLAANDDPFALDSMAEDSGPFAFEEPGDTGASAGSSLGDFGTDLPPLGPPGSISDDSLFSFEDEGDDEEEEDPFGSYDPTPAPPPARPELSRSVPETEAILAQAPLGPTPTAPKEDLDTVPLGYLPPAPPDGEEDTGSLHEVVMSRPSGQRPLEEPEPLGSQPPTEAAPAPEAPGSPAAPIPPPMPASLLALIGEDADEGPMPEGSGGTFSLISDEADPFASAPEGTPLAPEEPPPAPEAEVADTPAADDPWSAAFADPAVAFATEAASSDPDEGLQDRPEPPPEADGDPTRAVFTGLSPASESGPVPLDEEIPSDPLIASGDPGTFESLFTDDGLDDISDLDQDMEGWATPAPDAFEQQAPPEPEPPAPGPELPEPDAPFAPAKEDLAHHGTLVPDDLPPERPAPPAPAPAPTPSRSRGAKSRRTVPDFSYMFKGYHLFVTETSTVLFGHRYGSLLIDVHEYPCGDDLPEAYRRFLADKIAERFVPRSDLSRPVPKQLKSQVLDPELLTRAFEALEG